MADETTVTTSEPVPEIIIVDDDVQIITTEETSVEVVTIEEEPIEIITIGLQGPSGPPGPLGPQGIPGLAGVSYIYEQNDPALVWDIGHGLVRYPSVTIVDMDGDVVEADTQYIDVHNVRVAFGMAFSGRAFLN